jgi:SAM-dependent methyltransferase
VKNQSCTTAARAVTDRTLRHADVDPRNRSATLRPVVDRTLNYGREIVADFVAQVDTHLALDLGPGLGEDLAAVRRAHPSARVVGLEAHQPYVNRLRAAGVEVVTCDIEREAIPFADTTVDLIVANQVFEHVKEIFWILHECARVLKVGGSLVIGVPNLASFHNRVLLAVGRQPTSLVNVSAHVRGYTRRDLLATIEDPFPGGFRLASSAGANFYPLPGPLARRAARLWPGGAWGFFARFEKIQPYDGSYLRWPVTNQLESNFYLGPPVS